MVADQLKWDTITDMLVLLTAASPDSGEVHAKSVPRVGDLQVSL